MKPTPHLIAAAAIAVIATAICLPGLFAGAGSYPITGTEPKVAVPAPALLPAASAFAPLVEAFERPGDGNPFTLRTTSLRKGPRINLPPPPPLDVPAPPLLPIPEATP